MFGPQAREVLDALLEKYAEHGSANLPKIYSLLHVLFGQFQRLSPTILAQAPVPRRATPYRDEEVVGFHR